MRTTDELVNLVVKHAKKQEHRQKNRVITSLFAASVALFAGVASLGGGVHRPVHLTPVKGKRRTSKR